MRFPFSQKRDISDPVFFYSLEQDTCSWGASSLVAANQTENGDLCAYVPNTNPTIVYACPAPDAICWTMNAVCNGANSTTPSSNQISCSNGSPNTWCCDASQECTRTANQINVCWSKFLNPNKGVSVQAANSIASSIISVSQASALSSRLSGLSTSSSASSSTSSKESSTLSSSASSSLSSSATPGSSSSNSSSLSSGAIAGIVVGVILGLTLLIALVMLVLRRRRAHSAMDERTIHDTDFVNNDPNGYVYEKKAPAELMTTSSEIIPTPVEMPGDHVPVELPGRKDETLHE